MREAMGQYKIEKRLVLAIKRLAMIRDYVCLPEGIRELFICFLFRGICRGQAIICLALTSRNV